MTEKPKQTYELLVQEGLDLTGESERELLVMLGEALFGEHWRRPMASSLRVSHGTINSLANNPSGPLSPRVREALEKASKDAVFKTSLAHAIAVAVRDELKRRKE